MKIDTTKLVKAPALITELFAEDNRPCTRTLDRWRVRRLIPYYKIGHEIWYDIEKVRAALDRKNHVRSV
jgi:hypothetical protein